MADTGKSTECPWTGVVSHNYASSIDQIFEKPVSTTVDTSL